jgi:hypothetical protein
MYRGLCLVLIVALCLCGCTKKDSERETETAETALPPVRPAESNTPAPPAKTEHLIVATVRQFVNAIATGNYDRALALSVPGEFTQQGLAGMHEAFQWDQVTFTQAWLGAEQSAVITDFIPTAQGSATAAWAFNLVAAEDGRWLVRLGDMLPNQQMMDDYLAAFHEVAPNAKSIEP